VTTQTVRENPDPGEARNPLPAMFLLFLGGMTATGLAYFTSFSGADLAYGGDERSPQILVPTERTGEMIFKASCASCHQESGQGVAGAFPPLVGSPWLLDDPQLPVLIVLRGIRGPIEVKGATYNSVMPSFASTKDEDLAKVLSYVRSSWGNQAPAISADQIATLRKDERGQGDAWKGGAELTEARRRVVP
jgi:mono/diheme cytochrome c family protein